jgi:hypothetical protein
MISALFAYSAVDYADRSGLDSLLVLRPPHLLRRGQSARHERDTMLEHRCLRFGPSGPYIDGFAAVLDLDGYAKAIAKCCLRTAAHLGYFLQQRGEALTD